MRLKMATIKLKCSVWAKFDKYSQRLVYAVYDGGIKNCYLESSHIPIAPYEIEVEMPDGDDLYAGALKLLQIKRKLILANSNLALNTIDAEIQTFIAMEGNNQGGIS